MQNSTHSVTQLARGPWKYSPQGDIYLPLNNDQQHLATDIAAHLAQYHIDAHVEYIQMRDGEASLVAAPHSEISKLHSIGAIINGLPTKH